MRVDAVVGELAERELPAYVYDVSGMGKYAARVVGVLGGAVEVFYAAKANPDSAVVRAVGERVAGVEVASGGELRHVRDALPEARIAFGGPGKTDAELRLALALGVERLHVESPHELRRLAAITEAEERTADVLLRVNLAGERQGAALAMSGPFGMDPDLITTCLPILADAPRLRLRGVHAHLASGLDAHTITAQQKEILDWARPWLAAARVPRPEINLGGGMSVNYADPEDRFDWTSYGAAVSALALPDETLRIEPGRAMTVHHGWYVTDVLDVKRAHGRAYAVLRGGTHHFRTPVTKNHDQPFHVVPGPRPHEPSVTAEPVTLVGQLCTPKDVFARHVPVDHIAVGDRVVFAMAGAYAWNISHHSFLMHPEPTFHYL
ncbi:type III PLP-dependent enzyme [Actinocorallia sp. API 0066]|uniref:type III PLP-dependent enzyme n=1 Tax=Actinocorallia sp. API 0066 TaxID=2896846 RepID=UPI001E41570B|nr:type III PLP-dependent enzyme [Actinocorallia sp. API 0066]MCD0452454.1 type III PLP-dependent enzyme [Actinocorallia sp. API 0066]